MCREGVLFLALLAACGRDWRTDMWYQPARQARETPRQEPAGSVPLFARPQLDDRDDAVQMRSPFADDDASADRGSCNTWQSREPCRDVLLTTVAKHQRLLLPTSMRDRW